MTNASLCSGCHRLILAALLTIAGVIIALGTTRSANAEEPAVIIKMLDMPASYAPAQVEIKVGDTIEWKNVGNSVHHATSDPSMAMKPDDASTPAGATAFDSGFLRPGETYSYTFKSPGIYKYVCAPHETSGMIGKITVVPREIGAAK
jgi:plastocyanin